MIQQSTILLSGGIDSFVMGRFLQDQERDVKALFIDYGQPSSQQERNASLKVSDYLNIPFKEIIVNGLDIPNEGEIKSRNLLLVSLACAHSKTDQEEISIGIHSGGPYFDCSIEFLKECKKVISNNSNNSVSLIAPLVSWKKPQIIKYALDLCLPLEITYSCEKGTATPCGSCLSCLDRKFLNAS